MILYHGTSEYAAMQALEKGLRPRSETGEDNWTDTVSSNPSMVYLTDTYACHYACNARMAAPRIMDKNGKLSKRIAVIEIDTAGLPFTNFRADEDYLAFKDEKLSGMMTMGNLKERVARHRDGLTNEWKNSLAALGTCCYAGTIRPKHIKRVALFDVRKNEDMAMAMMDGNVSPMAFKLAGQIHRCLTYWLFGADIRPSDIIVDSPSDDPMWVKRREYWEGVIANREGIEIIDNG